MKEGFVTRVRAGCFYVYAAGKTYPCRARGKFRIDGTSPLAGDNVVFDEKDCYLLRVKPRSNFFIRPPIANVDRLIIVSSLHSPEVSLTLINRFATMALLRGVKPVLAISKIDLKEQDDSAYETIKKAYADLDFTIIFFSNKTGEGIDKIIPLLKGKKTVIAGQSGVGKSSLINRLIPGYKQETAAISKALGRGKHTTRVTEYLPFNDGWIADTPGFSLIDLDLKPLDLASFYPGFADLAPRCRFRNCLHERETECAVKSAVESGKISKEHYAVYLRLLTEIRNKKERYA